MTRGLSETYEHGRMEGLLAAATEAAHVLECFDVAPIVAAPPGLTSQSNQGKQWVSLATEESCTAWWLVTGR